MSLLMLHLLLMAVLLKSMGTLLLRRPRLLLMCRRVRVVASGRDAGAAVSVPAVHETPAEHTAGVDMGTMVVAEALMTLERWCSTQVSKLVLPAERLCVLRGLGP